VFAPPAIAAPAPVLPPKAPGKASSYWPLIIILNVVLIAAVALVLYFVLKPH
jgi:flagellar basal body-associated protein FliL